jgi:hypothetical protein
MAKKSNRRTPVKATQSKKSWGWVNAASVTAVIGFVGAIGAVVVQHYLDGAPAVRANHTSRLGLQVDSVTVESYTRLSRNTDPDGLPSWNRHAIVDFKVQNLGTRLIVITGVKIRLRFLSIGDGDYAHYLPRSAVYSTVFPFKRGIHEVPVSEEVGPSQADRFDIRIKLDSGAAYHVDFYLLYGRNKIMNAGFEILGS